MALSWSMDKIGPIGRTVEDCALVFAAIQGEDPADPSTVKGVPFVYDPTTQKVNAKVDNEELTEQTLSNDPTVVDRRTRGLRDENLTHVAEVE